MHLRVVSPTRSTEAVLTMLRQEPGATHLTYAPGLALKPAGDVVEADVAREAVGHLLEQLCALGIDRDGGITLERLDTTLSKYADQAVADAPGEPDDAVVWGELMGYSAAESQLTWTLLAFLTLACLLAAVGVVTNSPVTIVGAMVVGPEFGPFAAIAVGLVTRRWDLLRRACFTVAVAFPLALVVTAGASLLAEALDLFTPATLNTLDQVDFIYRVGPFSLVVALLAGAAGMIALVSDRSAALTGVFISVTTVPAAGFAVVAATLGAWGTAAQSALQLAVNSLGIVVAAGVVLALRHRSNGVMQRRPLSKA